MIRINPFAGEATGTMTRRDKINYYLDIAETVLTGVPACAVYMGRLS